MVDIALRVGGVLLVWFSCLFVGLATWFVGAYGLEYGFPVAALVVLLVTLLSIFNGFVWERDTQ